MSKLQERDVLLEPWFSINVAGSEMGEDMLKYVTAVEVVDEDEKLSEATIEVADLDMKWINGINIGNGSAIIIRMGHRKNHASIFRGKISLVEPDFNADGYCKLTIKCVDTGVEMMRIRHSKVYRQMSVSEVVELMHRTSGLECECDPTPRTSHISQTRETYAEFVHRWKKMSGFNYFRKPTGGYYFGKKKQTEFGTETLGYKTAGMEIISFKPTYVDIETEETEDEEETELEKMETIRSPYKEDYSKAPSGGAKIAGKA